MAHDYIPGARATSPRGRTIMPGRCTSSGRCTAWTTPISAARRRPRGVEQRLPRAHCGPGEGAGCGSEKEHPLWSRGRPAQLGARGPAHRRVHPDFSRRHRRRPRHDRDPRAPPRRQPTVARADHAPAGADRERQPPHARAAVQRRIDADAAR